MHYVENHAAVKESRAGVRLGGIVWCESAAFPVRIQQGPAGLLTENTHYVKLGTGIPKPRIAGGFARFWRSRGADRANL